MTNGLKAAVVLTAAAIAPAGYGQYSGVSHPEQVPVTTSPEGISQPVVYETAPAVHAADPKLRVRPADGMVVGVPASARMEGDAGPSIASAASGAAGRTVTERDDSAALRVEDAEFVGEARRADVDAQVVTHVDGPANELPTGTILKATLRERLSTTETVAGKEFHAELTEPVERDGRVLLPAGAVLTGRVTDVHGGRRISGAASLHLQPLTITMPDGMKYRIRAQVIDTSLYASTKVDDEGTILRKDNARKVLAAVGLTTGAAAAAGGVIAGVPGALVGAGIGAGVSTAVWLKQDRQTALPAGTTITFSLNQPLDFGLN